MDGLTNIITKIQNQCDSDCASIIESAKNKAEAILADANAKAEELKASIDKASQEKIKVIESKAVSSGELEYKRVILEKKSAIIDEAVKYAVKEICSSDDETYFSYIETLIKKNALVGNGTVKLSSKDLSRLPEGFENKLSSILDDGKSVTISKTPTECDGGVIIEYDEIRIDCTISSLVEDKMDEIRDRINKAVFA